MVWPYGIHRLSEAEIAALAVGELPTEIVQVLRAAELSKHTLLLEAIRRTVSRRPNCEGADLVEKAARTLSEVQVRAPEVVADVLGLPHFGFWAAQCLARLRSHATQELSPIWIPEIGHLATFAALSALRIGYPFQLAVPVRRGRVAFPVLGTALVGRPSASGWAQIRLDRWGASIRSASRTVPLPTGDKPGKRGTDPGWKPAVRIEAETAGVRLSVVLEVSDPFLRHLSPAATPFLRPVSALWQRRLEEAWQILVGHDRMAAAALASVVTTLVPLNEPRIGDLISATSGWAWGAIGMSLPTDVALVAETLQHEFHHLVLAAIEDLAPLVREENGALYYAPWRNDPRPASALIQGIYAHFGVAGFWRQQRRNDSPANQLRSEVKFTHAHRAARTTARTLADADVLTVTGRILIAGMLERLEAWRSEQVSHAAETVAAEISTEHELRWRLTHRHPDTEAIDALARAWLDHDGQAFVGALPSFEVIPYKHRLRSNLPELLELRYRDPLRFTQVMNDRDSVQSSNIALLSGNYAKARDGYAQLIKSWGDRVAWVGLLLTRYRLTGVAEPVSAQPDVIADVHDRIRSLTGTPPDVETLIAWLNKILASAE